jgi:hypothetical protein
MAAVMWVILILAIVACANRIHYTYLVLNNKADPERLERPHAGSSGAGSSGAMSAATLPYDDLGDRHPRVHLAHAAGLAARSDRVRTRGLGVPSLRRAGCP